MLILNHYSSDKFFLDSGENKMAVIYHIILETRFFLILFCKEARRLHKYYAAILLTLSGVAVKFPLVVVLNIVANVVVRLRSLMLRAAIYPDQLCYGGTPTSFKDCYLQCTVCKTSL